MDNTYPQRYTTLNGGISLNEPLLTSYRTWHKAGMRGNLYLEEQAKAEKVQSPASRNPDGESSEAF